MLFRYLYLLFLLVPAAACFAQQPLGNFLVQNKNNQALEKVVSLSLDSLQINTPVKGLMVVDNRGLKQVSQYQPDERLLLVWVQLNAMQQKKFTVMDQRPDSFPPLVYGRQVPERYDDFAWENNRIAYRMYGAALANTNENAFGIDVWGKRTPKLVIDNWYKGKDYHTDHGEGLDFYKVGFTLGAGDVAPFMGDSIYFPANYTRYKLIANGPLRICFELYYDAWQVGNVTVSATKRITLDAFEQMNTMRVTYNLQGADRLPVALGIVKRKAPGAIGLNEEKGLLWYWEPEEGVNGRLGLAVQLSSPKSMRVQHNHLLVLDTIYHNHPFHYRVGAAWSKGGNIQSAQDWQAYLLQPQIVQVQYGPGRKRNQNKVSANKKVEKNNP